MVLFAANLTDTSWDVCVETFGFLSKAAMEDEGVPTGKIICCGDGVECYPH